MPPRASATTTRNSNGSIASNSRKKPLVIVESPTKAATIERFLGDGYTVASSIGHIRDLPANASEIPNEYTGQPWARYGVNVDEDFAPLYIIPERAKPVVADLRRRLKNASELLLATDEDREGEAIAWHLVEVLKPKIPVRRLVFHEITQTAIEHALADPRDIDMARVQAQETRRVIDRLVGFGISEVLWKKIQPKLSAGRVQTPALRLIVDRERSRMSFKRALYWDLEAVLESSAHPEKPFKASLKQLAAKPLAEGRDFDAMTGALAPNRGVQHLLEADANRIAAALANAAFVVASVEKTPRTQRPRPPFITSTLQQAGSNQLRFNASRTMRAAQTLYQNGYITYMRTDSTTLSSQALTATRTEIQKQYGEENLPDRSRTYKSRASAQEAHEAIRPAGESFRHPDAVAADVDADAARLYELIWRRTLASQMRDAQLEKTTVAIEATTGTDGLATFEAEGDIVTSPGYLLVWQESASEDTEQNLLPDLAENERLQLKTLEPLKHETRPPNRWTEASLIAELEKLGIGRPSTYAAILDRIQDVYVERKGTSLIPEWVGFAVIQLMDSQFPHLANLAFTEVMEQDLDRIASQELDRDPWLSSFYFGSTEAGSTACMYAASDGKDEWLIMETGLRNLIDSSGENIDARAVCTIPLTENENGLAVRVGRYGPFLQSPDDENIRVPVPAALAPDELTTAVAAELLEQAKLGDEPLGSDPDSGLPIFVRMGRNGAYLQLGEAQRRTAANQRTGERPRTASIWPTIDVETITLEQAIDLLQYPRILGPHPDTSEEITAQDGPYGPYVRCGSESRSLPGSENERYEALGSVTFDEAVKILNAPRQFRGRGQAQALAELGPHPTSGAAITVRDGRYGPYVTDGELNASLRKGTDPESVTLADAVELLTARAARVAQGKTGRRRRRPSSRAKR